MHLRSFNMGKMLQIERENDGPPDFFHLGRGERGDQRSVLAFRDGLDVVAVHCTVAGQTVVLAQKDLKWLCATSCERFTLSRASSFSRKEGLVTG